MSPQHRPPLSDAEWAVMKAVWDQGPLALGDIYERLSRSHYWAYSTVKTLVRRMVEKGWLAFRPVGNSFLYSAAVERQSAIRGAIREFTDRVLGGALAPFLSYYAEETDISDEELAQLEELVKRRRRKGRP